ncbi:hypothetical protein F5Y19DRAFT_465994 [Xylariaceae sp. FL1651]|nr:hypothetical protein F5Y19DRAFT_465994 [Xylariaceae sp. FL1651]
MVAHDGGFDISGSTLKNGKAEVHQPQPVHLKVMAMWGESPESPTVPSFQKLFDHVDWEQTKFGRRDGWEPELRQMVRLMMADTSPCILYWGESQSIIYNEAYVPLVGEKHPTMMGMKAQENSRLTFRSVFPQFWADFDEIITQQRQNRLTAQGEASMLLIERHGFLEETYFDWKLIPVIGEDGMVKGSYGIPTDLTNKIIGQRQLECVHKLNDLTVRANKLKELWSCTQFCLSHSNKDIPVALIYSFDNPVPADLPITKANLRCTLETNTASEARYSVAPESVDLQHDNHIFAPAMLKALESRSIIVLDGDDFPVNRLLDENAWVAHEAPPQQYVVIPLACDNSTFAILITAISPYQRYGPLYEHFFGLVRNILVTQISRVRLAEEVKRQDQLAERAALNFQKSEQRFLRFAERSIAGLAMMDTDGKLIFANDAWHKFFGTNSTTVHSCPWLDYIFPEDVVLLKQWHDKAARDKKGGTFQLRSRLPFSQDYMYSDHRTGLCACYADLNQEGEVESIMLLIMDISEVKWIEQQLVNHTRRLQESEGNYRDYAEHCPLGIVRMDGEGCVIYGNDAWYEHYDFMRGELPHISQPWLPYVHDDDVEDCSDFFRKLQRHSGPEACEFRLKDRTFTTSEGNRTYTNDIYVLATGFSKISQNGTVEYIDFWVTDISDQKMAAKILSDKMEEAIRLKNQQERFIDMISHEIRNPLSAILHCGEEVVDAMKTGRAALDALGYDFLSPEALAPLCQSFRKQLDGALDAANTIMYCVQHQKQIVDDVLTLSKLDSDLLVVSPGPVELIALVRSSLKIFELELKVSDISLAIIEDESLAKLRVDWVMLDPKRFLQIIINLVTNAIKFTKLSSVRQITIKASAFTQRPTADLLYGVEYVPQRYPPKAPTSTFRSQVDYHGLDAGNDIYLSFSVTDTGTGLTESQKALLFNRFAQASPKTDIEYGGSGLGLFISRQITEMLGGEIGVSSTPGCGSTFAFYVKAQRIARPPPPTSLAKPDVPIGSSLGLVTEEKYRQPIVELETSRIKRHSLAGAQETPARSVLVVEDNLINQKVLCKQLRNRDFLVHAANHGREALDAIYAKRTPSWHNRTADFDVILCDIEMPTMDGIEFTKEVRRLESVGELEGHIPIVGVTANVRSTQVSGAIEAGMDGITTKPYRIHELIEHINRVCTAR